MDTNIDLHASYEAPEHIPARMLNEFVYCPRLFYLEWVDNRWANNADTEQGQFVHRAVDKREGALPDPEFADLLKRATSVQIESPRLGLTAIIDRVEGKDSRQNNLGFCFRGGYGCDNDWHGGSRGLGGVEVCDAARAPG